MAKFGQFHGKAVVPLKALDRFSGAEIELVGDRWFIRRPETELSSWRDPDHERGWKQYEIEREGFEDFDHALAWLVTHPHHPLKKETL